MRGLTRYSKLHNSARMETGGGEMASPRLGRRRDVSPRGQIDFAQTCARTPAACRLGPVAAGGRRGTSWNPAAVTPVPLYGRREVKRLVESDRAMPHERVALRRRWGFSSASAPSRSWLTRCVPRRERSLHRRAQPGRTLGLLIELGAAGRVTLLTSPLAIIEAERNLEAKHRRRCPPCGEASPRSSRQGAGAGRRRAADASGAVVKGWPLLAAAIGPTPATS